MVSESTIALLQGEPLQWFWPYMASRCPQIATMPEYHTRMIINVCCYFYYCWNLKVLKVHSALLALFLLQCIYTPMAEVAFPLSFCLKEAGDLTLCS